MVYGPYLAPLIFINKVLLEQSYTHLFMYYLWLLSSNTCKVEQLQQRLWPESLKYLLAGPLQKQLANPCFKPLLPSCWVILPFFFAGKWPGQCPCKEGYAGEKCDRCQFGYKGYPACVPCDCNPAGSVNEEPCSEACLCKVRVEVKAAPEFPLRFPENGMHFIASDDQALSKASRCKWNYPFP